jgi:hypothetical protein
MAEIRDGNRLVADLAGQMSNFLVGSFQEFIQNAELVHDFESGRMNRVAAEVAEEVGMLLQHDYIDSHARQEETEHDAGRTSSSNAATGAQGFRHGCDSKYNLQKQRLEWASTSGRSRLHC